MGRSETEGKARAATFAAAALCGLLATAAAGPVAARQEAVKDPKMAPQSQQTMMQNMAQDAREIRKLQCEDRERTYLTKMMDHHQSGIEMARLALKRSQSTALKAEARQIIREQTAEINRMRRHLASSHRVKVTAKPDPRMQPTMEKLERLSGAEFDRAFAQEMSVHHQGAIDMSYAVIEGGVPHRSVKTMASRIVRGNRKSQKDLAQAVRVPPRTARL